MSTEDSGLAREPSPLRRPVSASRGWLRPVGIALGVLGALGLFGFLAFHAMFGATTVTVTNVGDRPVEGIVLLAVSDTSEVVRDEWPIGTLRPGESREVDDVYAKDTD